MPGSQGQAGNSSRDMFRFPSNLQYIYMVLLLVSFLLATTWNPSMLFEMCFALLSNMGSSTIVGCNAKAKGGIRHPVQFQQASDP
jgi:hypothetical protein